MLDAHAHVMQVNLCKANTRGVTRGVPSVAGNDRVPRSEESPVSLAMTEHQGARSLRRRWR